MQPKMSSETDPGEFKKPVVPVGENVEKQQEAMLRSKYKNLPPKGGAFLQQRLARHKNKYFDSGDYNMAKAKNGGKIQPTGVEAKEVTGDHMPTPAELPQMRKSSQSKLAMH